MGGAIGHIPNALRALPALGVMDYITTHNLGASIDRIELFDIYTSAKLGEISFTDPTTGEGIGKPPFEGLRILRSDLLNALLRTAAEHENITIQYGHGIATITPSDTQITLTFTNPNHVPETTPLLISADGIHSVVRTLLVDPTRTPTYTGIAGVSGFSPDPTSSAPSTLPPPPPPGTPHCQPHNTLLLQSRRGSLVLSPYTSTDGKAYFLGAVMETADVLSKEGWYAEGREHERLKSRVVKRYADTAGRMEGCERGGRTERWVEFVARVHASGRWELDRRRREGGVGGGCGACGE